MISRVALPNDQWIDVKDRLKVVDKKNVHSYSVDGVSSDGKTYRFNVVKHHIATAAVRIVNWGLKDETGKLIPWPTGKPFDERVTVIEGLDEEQFDGLVEALGARAKEVEAEAADEKKESPAGVTT